MDPKPIVHPLLDLVVAQGTVPVAPVSGLAADEAMVARFQRSLAGAGASDDLAGPQDLGAVGSPGAGPANPGAYRTFGDAILDGLGALSSQVQRAWNGVRGVGPADPNQPLDPNATGPVNALPKVGELMAMQRDMVEFSFMFEALGKGTSKAIDNTNQLVKMQ